MSPVFEADRVRGQHNYPTTCQSRAKRLKGIANQPADFTLPEVPLAVVLVMDEYRREWNPITLLQLAQGRVAASPRLSIS